MKSPISPGFPSLPMGIDVAASFMISPGVRLSSWAWVSKVVVSCSVRTGPGRMLFTVILKGASSRASIRAYPITAIRLDVDRPTSSVDLLHGNRQAIDNPSPLLLFHKWDYFTAHPDYAEEVIPQDISKPFIV